MNDCKALFQHHERVCWLHARTLAALVNGARSAACAHSIAALDRIHGSLIDRFFLGGSVSLCLRQLEPLYLLPLLSFGVDCRFQLSSGTRNSTQVDAHKALED